MLCSQDFKWWGTWILLIALGSVGFVGGLLVPRTVVHAQANLPITITTPADLTGNGAAQQMTAITCTGRWVQFVAPASNSAIVRVGDSNTSASRGLPMAAGSGLLLPPATNVNYIYSPSALYFYAANGDKLSVACGSN